MSSIARLGYAGIEVSDMAAWETFATSVLGLSVGERRRDGSLVMRMDNQELRILLTPGDADDLAFAGFELDSMAELDNCVGRLRGAGYEPTEADSATAASRCAERVWQLTDPSGIPIELFLNPSTSSAPLENELVASGFNTGAEGLGHMVIKSTDRAATETFYGELLGMGLSDIVSLPMSKGRTLDITFLHANARHHTVAFASMPMKKRIDHIMFEVNDMSDVGLAHERAIAAGVPIRNSLGQHPNDMVFSFYAFTPSGFAAELGYGGRKIDADWEVGAYDTVSIWGHDGLAQTS